jgi:hypothetical protein
MISCFAIIPDGQDAPAALFTDLEDAMDWGLRAFGGNGFRIRHIEVAQVEKDESPHLRATA